MIDLDWVFPWAHWFLGFMLAFCVVLAVEGFRLARESGEDPGAGPLDRSSGRHGPPRER